jgi:type IV secretory pathway VirB2 component (pilin)
MDDLGGLAIETSSRDAQGLDRDAELVLVNLQPHQACGVVNADRIESARSPTGGWSLRNERERGEAMVHVDRYLRASGVQRRQHLWRRALVLAIVVIMFVPASSYAQASPWENAVNVLMTSFTGPIARGLSLVSIVVGGVTFAFGEGGSKRLLAGIIFGVGMAIGAVNFMAWLFP